METEQGSRLGARIDALKRLAMETYSAEMFSHRREVYERVIREHRRRPRADFAGAETLRAALLKCPKYGNDDDEPDGLLRDLVGDFRDGVERCRNPRRGRFQVGLYTVDGHALLGERTGALPDGRRSGVALASAMSPAQGADILGPTAVIRSATKIDHRICGNEMVLDLKFNPGFFVEMRRRGLFKPLVESYFRLGGLEVQFNVVSRETLLDAQAHPEEYRNLLVRVSGFSAYFVDLSKTIQDEIIARTEMTTI